MVTDIHITTDPFLEKKVSEEADPNLKRSLATAIRVPGDFVSLGLRGGTIAQFDIPPYLQSCWKHFMGGRSEGLALRNALCQGSRCEARVAWVIDDVVSVDINFVADATPTEPQRPLHSIYVQVVLERVVGQPRQPCDV